MAKVKKDDATLIEDEVEAIDGYDKAISNETDPERKEVLEHIRDEEKEHIKEIEDMDKDMTSDEAWQDFKSNYDKEEFDEAHKDDVTAGESMAVAESKKVKNMKSTRKSTDAQNQSTLDGKLDTVATMINELETDVERTLDVIPQVEGQVAGEVAEGGEAEDDMFNVDSMFGDDAGEEGAVDEEGNPVNEEGEVAEGDAEGGVADGEQAQDEGQQVDADGNPIEDDGEATGEGETPAEDSIGDDQSSDEAEADSEAEGDEDMIPIDEVMDEEDDDEKLMESMVKTIVKQNKLIKSLTKRVEVLEKNQKNMTVQKQSPARKVAIRHQPIYKSVGVVSKPPVQNGFNSQFNVGDDESAMKSFKDPKALVASYKNKGIL